MQHKPARSYAHLKDRLATWSNRQDPNYPSDSLRQHFLLVAQEQLLPELRKLAHILIDNGMECEVFAGDETDDTVGIRMDTVGAVLRLSPADRPTCIRAIIAGGRRPNHDLEWFIPYGHIANGGLERELQAVMIRLLNDHQTAA